MAETKSPGRHRSWQLAAAGVLWCYTVWHYLHASLAYRGYDDFFLLLHATRGWLATHRFPIEHWYPPIFFFVNAPLALLDDMTAVRIMLVLNHLLLVGCFGLLAVALADAPRRPPWRLWGWLLLPLALNFRPLLVQASMAKIEMLQLALLTGALLAWQRNRHLLTGALAAAAGMLKPLPLLFMPYLLWRRNWRALAGWALVIAAVLAFSEAIFGMGSVRDYYSMVSCPRGAEARYWYEDQSLMSMAARLFHPPRPNQFFIPPQEIGWLEPAVGWCFRLLLVIWLIRLLPWRDQQAHERRWGEWAIVSAAMLLLSPFSRDYYAIFLIPGYLLLSCGLWARGAWWRSWSFWLLATSYLLVGQGIPLGFIQKLPELVPGIDNARLYLHYSVPTCGYLLFIAAWGVRLREAEL